MAISYELQTTIDQLKGLYWGWNVLYWPDYVDYITYKTVKEKYFFGLLERNVTVIDKQVKAKDMAWTYMDQEWVNNLFHYTYHKPLYFCVLGDQQTILVR
jgi:hypothetical protein